MSLHRRGFIAGSGAAVATLAGCLQLGAGWGDDRRTPTDAGTPRPGDPAAARLDLDDLSIGGHLHNAADETRTVEVEIRDEGDRVFGLSITLPGSARRRLPHWDAPGGTRTVRATAGETTVVETLSFDVAPTESRIDGYVVVTAHRNGPLDVAVASAAEVDARGTTTRTPI